MKVFKWSIRDGLPAFLLWMAGFCGVCVFIVLLFPSLDTLIDSYIKDVSLILAMMGKEAQFIKGRSLFDLWMTLEFFTWMGMFCSGYAIIFAAGTLSGEVENRSMEMLLAQPVSRESVLLGKFAALMVNLALLGVAVFAAIWLSNELGIEAEASYGLYVHVFFNNGMMLFAVAGFAFLVSALADEPKKVIGITLGVLLFSFLINITVTAADKWVFLGRFTPFYYCDASQIFHRGSVLWSHILTLFAAGIVLLTASLIAFRKKDIKG